ncbi:MAG TPA: hypothetical protein VKS20_03805 [Candidatus Acidoferrales bacterium]|nr:hypothetical protein [Candidatus Acidoferrales bacterium]
MSKHHKHKHSHHHHHHHHHRSGTSADSKWKPFDYDGKKYEYLEDGGGPCQWRLRRHGHKEYEYVDAFDELSELDNALLRAITGEEEEAASESSESSDESGSGESGENEKAPKKSKTPPVVAIDAAGEIKRNKYGVKLFSNDGKHYLQFVVNNSKNFPGRFSVRLHVGVQKTYTFRKEEMRALLREVARAFSPKERRELL